MNRSDLTCPPQTLLLATRQLACLLRSGVPLLRALEVVSPNPDDALSQGLRLVLEDVQSGHRLSSSLARHPGLFPNLYQVMVRIGETTGALVNCLEQLASWLEQDQSVRARVLRALAYPGFVLLLSASLAVLVVWQVIPPFGEMFRQAAIPLPWPTRLLLLITRATGSPLCWLLGGLSLAGYAVLVRRRLASEEGACAAFHWLTRIPVLGWMLHSAALARWSAALQSLLTAGVDLSTSLRLAGQAAGDPRLARDARQAASAVAGGEPLSDHLFASPLFPAAVGALVAAGEESSRMPAMLGSCADMFQQELDSRIELLGAALEPLLLTGVAAMVGFVLLAIFLPMYSFVDQLGA